MCAFVDESMQQTGAPEERAYLLAAAVTETARCEEIRQTVRSLRHGREKRLHWYDQEPTRHTKIAETIGALGMAATVVIGTPLHRRSERARRKCMESLLPRLESMGVDRVVLEARTPSQNVLDEQHLLGMRGRRLITRALWVEIARSVDEPLLWVPDAIAGAYGAARTTGQREWLDLIGRVEEIEISTQ